MSVGGVGGPASRPLRENELNAVINALDTNGNKVLEKNELNISTADLRRRLDFNRDGRFQADEVKFGFQNDMFSIQLNRSAAEQVLLKMDSNQDGYLSRNELELNDKMMNLVDGYGSRKYGSENGQRVYDAKGRVRETGRAAKDGSISISEMANAFADGHLKIGDRIRHMQQ